MTNRRGLAIGVLTDGMLNVDWLENLEKLKKGIPGGMYYKILTVKGTGYREKGGYALARTEIVKRAKKLNVKWLLFLDSDVFPMADAITQLLACKKDVVSGIYYMKTDPPQPVLYEKFGDGPLWDFEPESVFKIGSAGAGILLINMEVFDKFDEKDTPYFAENWDLKKKDGSIIHVDIGEDHFFFHMCNKLGIETWCNSSVICTHVDYHTGRRYPNKDEAQRVRRKVLEKFGKQEELKKEDELYKINNDRRTIVFMNNCNSEFSGDALDKRPVGGAETAIINTAKFLAQHYNVFVVSKCSNPGIFEGVRYIDIHDSDFMSELEIEWFISVRNALLFQEDMKEKYNIKHTALWCHDFAASPAFDGIEETVKNIDKIIVLTQWHKENILSHFSLPEDKFVIIPNGVNKERFYEDVEKEPFTCVYSSTPYRGLDVLIDIWPKIKKAVPEAKLKIFSSMKVYNIGRDKDDYLELYDEIQKLDGVSYYGSVKQDLLAKELQSCSLYLYPCTYEETFFIGGLEAIYARCPIISNKLGAIPETVPDNCRVLIEGSPFEESVQREYIDTVIKLLTSKRKDLATMQKNCNFYFGKFEWRNVAKNFWKALIEKHSFASRYNFNCKEYFENTISERNQAKVRYFEKVPGCNYGIMPKRSHSGSSCYDFFAPNDFEIKPGENKIVKTGIRVKMQEDEVFKLYVRSRIGINHGIGLSNGTGVIDSNYYDNHDNLGEILVPIRNSSKQTFICKKNDRLAQGMFQKYLLVDGDSISKNKFVKTLGATENKNNHHY